MEGKEGSFSILRIRIETRIRKIRKERATGKEERIMIIRRYS